VKLKRIALGCTATCHSRFDHLSRSFKAQAR
jgi:hypothetical protein